MLLRHIKSANLSPQSALLASSKTNISGPNDLREAAVARAEVVLSTQPKQDINELTFTQHNTSPFPSPLTTNDMYTYKQA